MRPASVVAALSVAACGGLVFIDYSDPDADLSAAQDGGGPDAPTLRHAGSACVDYDASALFEPGPTCAVDLDCLGFDAGWPSGLRDSIAQFSACDAGRCEASFANVNRHSTLRCSNDGLGDAYCTAYAQQYVTHGQAVARCAPYVDDDGHVYENERFCAFGCSQYEAFCAAGPKKNAFCVAIGGTRRCAVPCADESMDISP